MRISCQDLFDSALFHYHGADTGRDYVVTTLSSGACDALAEEMGVLVLRATPKTFAEAARWVADAHRRGATLIVSREEAVMALSIASEVGAAMVQYDGVSVKVAGASRTEVELAILGLLDPEEVTGQHVNSAVYRAAAMLAGEVPVVRDLGEAASLMHSWQPAITTDYARELISYFAARDQEALESMTRLTQDPSVTVMEVGFDRSTVDYILANPDQIFLAAGATGSGKTWVAEELSRELNGEGVVVTGPRRSILRATFQDLPYYEELTRIDSLRGLSSLRVCIPSLPAPRFTRLVKKAELLVVDEIAQSIRDIYTGEIESPVRVLEELITRIAETPRVYLADADANDQVISLLKATGRKITLLVDRKRGEALKHLKATFMPSSQAWNRLLEDHRSGESIYFATDSRKEARRVAKKLESEPRIGGEPARVLLITSDTVRDRDVQAFLADPDNFPVDHVVTSPSAQSGLSIMSDRFTKVHLAPRGVVTHTDCVQMARRVRKATHVTIGVDVRHHWTPDADARIQSMQDLAGTLTDFDKAAERAKAEHAFSAAHQAAGIWYLLESQGATCVRADASEDEEQLGKSERRSAAQLDRTSHEAELLAAKPLSPEEARALRDQGVERTSEQAIREERYRLEETWGLTGEAITIERVRLWRDGLLAKQKAAWKDSMRSEEASRKADQAEAAKGVPAARRRYLAERRAVARLVLDTLNITREGASITGRFSAEDAMRLIASLGEHRSRLAAMGEDLRISAKDVARAKEGKGSWTRRADSILAALFGLKTEAGFESKDGSRFRVRVISESRVSELAPMLVSAGVLNGDANREAA